MEKSSFEKVDCFLETHFARFSLENCDNKILVIRDSEIRSKTRSSRRSNACLNAQKSLNTQQLISVFPSDLLGMTECTIKNFATIVLPRHYITKDGITHGVISKKRDILRARICLFVHKAMCVYEMGTS